MAQSLSLVHVHNHLHPMSQQDRNLLASAGYTGVRMPRASLETTTQLLLKPLGIKEENVHVYTMVASFLSLLRAFLGKLPAGTSPRLHNDTSRVLDINLDDDDVEAFLASGLLIRVPRSVDAGFTDLCAVLKHHFGRFCYVLTLQHTEIRVGRMYHLTVMYNEDYASALHYDRTTPLGPEHYLDLSPYFRVKFSRQTSSAGDLVSVVQQERIGSDWRESAPARSFQVSAEHSKSAHALATWLLATFQV